MKILFVCLSNVGRSQMAMEYYNQMTSSNDANSAGVEVYTPGETLQERRDRKGGIFVIDAMKQEGIDVRDNTQHPVTKDMLEDYDKVICMAQKESTPDWLENAPNTIRWDVEDPGGKGLEETVIARDIIKSKVADLVNDKKRR